MPIMKSEIMHDLYTIKPICKIMYAKLHTAKSAETVVFAGFCACWKSGQKGENWAIFTPSFSANPKKPTVNAVGFIFVHDFYTIYSMLSSTLTARSSSRG